eukprot:929218-Prymnesium_polylepis.1
MSQAARMTYVQTAPHSCSKGTYLVSTRSARLGERPRSTYEFAQVNILAHILKYCFGGVPGVLKSAPEPADAYQGLKLLTRRPHRNAITVTVQSTHDANAHLALAA